MNTIEIKTDLSGEELQVLIWEIEAFCEVRRLPKPVLRQTYVSGQLPNNLILYRQAKKLDYAEFCKWLNAKLGNLR